MVGIERAAASVGCVISRTIPDRPLVGEITHPTGILGRFAWSRRPASPMNRRPRRNCHHLRHQNPVISPLENPSIPASKTLPSAHQLQHAVGCAFMRTIVPDSDARERPWVISRVQRLPPLLPPRTGSGTFYGTKDGLPSTPHRPILNNSLIQNRKPLKPCALKHVPSRDAPAAE